MELQTITRSHNGYLWLASITFLILFLASNTISLPSVVPAILSLCWMLVVPFGIGHIFAGLPLKGITNLSAYLSEIGIANIFIKWSIGFLLIMAISIPLSYAGVNTFAIGAGLVLIVVFRNLIPFKITFYSKVNPNLLRIVIITLILGISLAAYVRSFSPYPLTPGMDIFTHLYVINSITNNSLGDSPLVYLPIFDMLIALGSSTFQADPVEIFWLGSFVITCIFALGLYALSFWILKNHVHSFLTTVIGLLVTEQGLASNLQFFYPSSFIMSVFPAMFFVIHSIWKQTSINKAYKLILTSIPFAVLLLIHFQLGGVAILLVSIYFISSYIVSKHNNVLLLFRIITIALASILLLYYYGYTDSQLQLTLIDGQYSYPTPTKIRHLNEWYTDAVVTMSILGLMLLSFFGKKAVLIGFITSIALLIYFQQIDWIHRFMTLERSLLSFAAAALLTLPILLARTPNFLRLMSIFQQFSQKLFNRSHDYAHLKSYVQSSRYSTYISKASVGYLAIVIALLFPTLMQPFNMYVQQYAEKNISFVNFSSEELSTANWIAENIPRDYILYSDPATVIEMRGLAYRENLPGIGHNKTIQDLVWSAMVSKDASAAYDNIISNAGEEIVIVISPRTAVWVSDPSRSAVQFPIENFRAFDGFEKFFDNNYFTLEYKSQNIFIFTLNNNLRN